jgi:DHA1 family bicyclomycin/chloramphenicol resistance-like MFS transporter
MFDVKSAVPMVAIMTGTTIVALLILLIGRRNIKVQVQADKDNGMVIH